MPLGVLGVLKNLSGFREKGDVYRLWLRAFSRRAFGVSCVTWLFFCRAPEAKAGMGYPLLSTSGARHF